MSIASTGTPAGVDPGKRSRRRTSTFRPEIQGLRSLAVLMVVTYHVWFGRVSGGVDVFLMLSAFLMTLQFTGRYQRREPAALGKHWLHLFRRLLPAAVTVIVATLAASALLLPRTRWLGIMDHGWAALFYFENVLLQQQSVDYYANDHSLANPLQHFWSLSIQGQVFILWPLIFVVAAFVARRAQLSYRLLLSCIFGATFAVSLIHSAVFTAANQEQAYFDTGARLWEFALGTLVALILPGLRLGRTTRIVMGWIGVVAMLACGIAIDVEGVFPGVAALWPTTAAALVIIAGQSQSRFGVDRILAATPLVRLGEHSYALYLWHWPVLVIALAWSGKEHAGWLSGSIIILTSLGLAYLTTRFIEKPWREWTWPEVTTRRAALAVALTVAVAAAPLTLWRQHIMATNSIASIGTDDPRYPGALALSDGYVYTPHLTADPVPKPEVIAEEWPVFPEPCIGAGEYASICTNGVQDPAKHIVILGNSHAYVLNTPVQMMAEKHNWKVTSITKGFCPLTGELGPGITEECLEFNQQAMDEVLKIKPDLVLTISTRTFADPALPEVIEDSWISEVSRLNNAGIPVLGVRDTPRMPVHVPNCLGDNPLDVAACSGNVVDSFGPVSAVEAVSAVDAELPDTRFLDLTPYFCPEGICPAVIGNVIVYKDENHVTRSYLMTLASFFEQEFLAATGWES